MPASDSDDDDEGGGDDAEVEGDIYYSLAELIDINRVCAGGGKASDRERRESFNRQKRTQVASPGTLHVFWRKQSLHKSRIIQHYVD